MEKQLILPALSPDSKKCVLCAWLKDEGEKIEYGEPIYEVESEKVVHQVEATESGILKKKLFSEGDEVTPMSAVAILNE